MTKPLEEKHCDTRTVERYLTKGVIKKADFEAHLKALPNDEENFELTTFEDDELGLGQYSEEEVASMAPISEADINRFDYMDGEED